MPIPAAGSMTAIDSSRPANTQPGETMEELFPGPTFEPRQKLPQQAEPLVKPSILRTVSEIGSVGIQKYMYVGNFPTPGCEPMTELMRRVENMQYAKLLEQAAALPKGSVERLLLVTAFNISGWSGPATRTQYKAMRPLDFETYELVCPERGFKAVIEVVERDPDNRHRSTVKAWGRGWTLEGEHHVAARWLGTSIAFDGNYKAVVTFDDGDSYFMRMPAGRVTGLAGSPVYSHNGNAVVTHLGSKLGTLVDLTEPGMLSREKRHKVKGFITDDKVKTGEAKISGYWDSVLEVIWKDGRVQTLWEAERTPANNPYSMRHFAVQLNHLPPELDAVLPPTDSRRRPDTRAVEVGRFQEAHAERDRLGMLAADRRAQAVATGAQLKPRWFAPRQAWEGDEGELVKFSYAGGYWEARAAAALGQAHAWQGCMDIMGKGL